METMGTVPFGTQLKRYRHTAALTQAALAERAGYSSIYIRKLERGERVPLPVTVAVLAHALGLAPADQARLEAAAALARTKRTPPALPPLVGRTLELGVLAQHLADQGPPLLVLAGEPGIGKTRLLQEAAGLAEQGGWTVLAGGCHRRSGQAPYAPLVDALERCLSQHAPDQQRQHLRACPWLVRLLPELTDALPDPLPAWNLPPADERRLMFTAVRRFLHSVAGAAGTLLVLDDLQWAGADALDLLAHLLRASPERPLRVIGAYRQTEVRPLDPLAELLADLAREGVAQRAALGPLSPPEATALLRGLLAGIAPAQQAVLAQQVLSRAGGVPYFLVSCAQAAQAGALERGPTAGQEQVPWSVAESIGQRVAALSAGAQSLLGAAAVAGREVSRALLLALARPLRWDQQELLSALESACQARLLVEHGEADYGFAHDLIREAVVADLSAARRASLHQQIAEALEQQGGELPVEALAEHYTQAGIPAKALVYLEQAGDKAQARFAHAEAQRYYRELVAGLHRLGQRLEEAQAQEKLGLALTNAGHYDQALAVYEQAINAYQGTNDVERLGRATAQMLSAVAFQGTSAHDPERFHALLVNLERLPPSGSLVDLYVNLAYQYLITGRHREMRPFAERATEIARLVGEGQCLAAACYGYALLATGATQQALQVAEETIPLAQAAGHPLALTQSLHLALLVQAHSGNFALSQRYAAQALEHAERWGAAFGRAFLQAFAGQVAFFRGDWDEASRLVEQALALGRQVEAPRVLLYPLIEGGRLRLAQGARDEAARMLEESLQIAARYRELIALGYVQSLQAERELLEGRPEAARARLAPLLAEHAVEEWGITLALPMLVWAEVEVGHLAEAERLVAEGAACLRARNERLTVVDLLWASARLALRQQHWQEAKEALEEALGLAQAMPYPYGEVKTLCVYGQLHTQQGEPERARERWKAALAICVRLGERLYAERIEAALAQLEG